MLRQSIGVYLRATLYLLYQLIAAFSFYICAILDVYLIKKSIYSVICTYQEEKEKRSPILDTVCGICHINDAIVVDLMQLYYIKSEILSHFRLVCELEDVISVS